MAVVALELISRLLEQGIEVLSVQRFLEKLGIDG